MNKLLAARSTCKKLRILIRQTHSACRDECEKLRAENAKKDERIAEIETQRDNYFAICVERSQTIAAQSAALEMAKMALSMPCNFWNKTQHEKIKEALAAINALPAAPAGWKLVPVVPTEEMLFAGHMKIDFDRNDQNTFELEHPSQTEGGGSSVREDMADAWSAMLAAAPKGSAE